MIESFKNKATEDVFNGANTKAARKLLSSLLWRNASRKLDQIDSIRDVEELRIPPGNRSEVLEGDREGQYSIRINDQYRICFRWNGKNSYDVEITDYH